MDLRLACVLALMAEVISLHAEPSQATGSPAASKAPPAITADQYPLPTYGVAEF